VVLGIISAHSWLTFIAAVMVLMLIPGPNVALITANSAAHGARFGLLTVAGTAAAMAVQLAVTALGMTAFLGHAGSVFGAVRWAGVVYLIYLGIAQWRAAPVDLKAMRPEPPAPRVIFLRGLLVSLTNPKTLFFYSAFFPQFVAPGREIGGQVALLSGAFLGIAVLVDSGWALLAHRARLLIGRHGRLRNRLTGGVLVGAGIGLAVARER
jgi:threonine/homoserine/homoserine lactone efflux protein